MSDTPRTDAREWDWHEDCSPVDDMIVDANFARQLERELAEARDKIKNLHRLLENILKPDSDGQDYKEARKYLAILKGGEA
jgi:hypothetical protein